MDLQSLLQSLSYGKLRHHYAGMGGEGNIAPEEVDRIVGFAGKALTRIHTQFSAKRHYVKLQTSTGRQVYKISPIYAVSNTDPSNTAPRYILDSSGDPMPDRLIKIREVDQLTYPGNTYFERTRLWLNDESQLSVKTVSYDTIRFAEPIDGAIYELELQLDHTKLVLPADLDQEIIIPAFLEDALEAYIASEVYSAMGTEASIAKSQLLMAEFNQAMAMVHVDDLMQQTFTDENRPRDPGWV